MAMKEALHLGPKVANCPHCEQPVVLVPEYHASPRFVWTDGWVERRDGSPIPPGWVQCPHCQAVDTHSAWERTFRYGDGKNSFPSALEPTAEALRAHLEELLKGRRGTEEAHALRLQRPGPFGPSTPHPIRSTATSLPIQGRIEDRCTKYPVAPPLLRDISH